MSSFKGLFIAVGICLSALLYGCTVEPLYRQTSQLSTTITPDTANEHPDIFSSRRFTASHSESDIFSSQLAAKFASIIVEEPSDRFGQMVRNHLLFLMYGHGGKPSTPAYRLSLETSVFTRHSERMEAMLERGREEDYPFVETVVSRASYILQDMKNVLVAKGTGAINTSFDRLRQEYATMQAEENARERAARELAEQIFMLLSKDVAKL
ncbi:hypothetical protein BAnh1_11820 [Bartonella australis AUST/NH1]|uniref:LPS-assembly lipoprotein n=1 Tax=Bartonella australis (strain Aust/NH1) TaxID=1094489 RepID=M1N5A0_BARAA|nr:LPS assembly lipoprotein LptE [Bartonella australis]AGF75049.1 hypothetical protein BAnh1_11820 [Bartonella australis AUST/NH1]